MPDENFKDQTCPICGAPATNGGHEFVEITRAPGGERRFDKLPRVFGCDAHPAVIRCFNEDGSVCLTPPLGRPFITLKQTVTVEMLDGSVLIGRKK